MSDAVSGDVPESVLRWAADRVAVGADIVVVERLRTHSGPWLLQIEHSGVVTEAVLKCGPAHDWQKEYGCELAGLEFAALHDIPVPRVLGSQLAADAPGDPVALLIERLPGDTRIPIEPDTERLRTLGRTAALLHRVPLTPTDRLPLRERHTSWTDFSTWRRWARRYRAAPPSRRDAVLGDFVTGNPGWSIAVAREEFDAIESTPLLDEADERIAATRIARRPTVFVHGDLWQGNTLWDGDRCTGVIDWETAGAGHPGVDLGCLRWDAALKYGDAADVDAITDGWEEVMGAEATDVAYSDAVAALNVRADLGGFVVSMTEHGRGDLDGPTLTANNSAFLESALSRL